jgi:formiminotetrahydrofolate cyclodeaminase
MVAAMSRGKKAYAQYEPQLSAAVAKLTPLREEFKNAIDADANSYNAVMKAYKEAKTASEADGQRRIDSALQGAAEVPLTVAERARELQLVVESLKPITNPNMASDLTVASALTRAAIEGALANVAINLESIKDVGIGRKLRARAAAVGHP